MSHKPRWVLDEWVWADLIGENGDNARKETTHLLGIIYRICHSIIVGKGSPFAKKLYAYLEEGEGVTLRRVLKSMLLNLQKVRWVSEERWQEQLLKVSPQCPRKDQYLVALLYAGEGEAVVTTDRRLYEWLTAAGIKAYLREEFLSGMKKSAPQGELKDSTG